MATTLLQRHNATHGPSKGFSLVEILVVLSIVSILSLLVSAGFQSVIGTAFNSETSDIANTLMRARAYAMANNTYVFVGIEEVDASKSSSGVQTAASGTIGGRIGVTVVASNDGTRGYAVSSLPSVLTPASLTLPPSSLTVVSPLHHYEGIHMATASSIANLPNAASTAGASYYPAKATGSSATTFSWPLTGTAQYSFAGNPGTVIQFNPQGEVQIIGSSPADSVLQWIEFDLVPYRGNNTSGSAAKDTATILIDGASGSVSTYRS